MGARDRTTKLIAMTVSLTATYAAIYLLLTRIFSLESKSTLVFLSAAWLIVVVYLSGVMLRGGRRQGRHPVAEPFSAAEPAGSGLLSILIGFTLTTALIGVSVYAIWDGRLIVASVVAIVAAILAAVSSKRLRHKLQH